MGARIARSENLDKAPEGAGWEDSYASRARSDGRFAQTFAVAYVPEFFATLKTPTSFVFGDWSDLAAQMHNRSLDMLAV